MTNFLFFLNNNSIVEASIEERDDLFLGEMECETPQLIAILSLLQAGVDAATIQLSEKADRLFHKNNKGIN